MPLLKNTASRVNFDLMDSSGAFQAGKTVTAQVSKDGGAFATAAGPVKEIGNGTYSFAGQAADLNCDAFTLRFSAAGCRDTFVHGNTESVYTQAIADDIATMASVTSGPAVRATVASGSTASTLYLTAITGYPLATTSNAYVGSMVKVVNSAASGLVGTLGTVSGYNATATPPVLSLSPGLPIAPNVGDTIEIR